MIVNKTNIMPDSSEVISYDDAGLPFYARRGVLSTYPGMRAAAHWHEDLEFIKVKEGEMNYSVNGKNVHLDEGSCLFVNSRQLHFGFDEGRKECIFLCILIHPSLLYRDNESLGKYLEPMLEDSTFSYCYLSGAREETQKLAQLLETVFKQKQEKTYAYHFEVLGIMTQAVGEILNIWHSGQNTSPAQAGSTDSQLDLQRSMVAFIEENFSSDITLDDIAGSGSVSRSTCCRLFRKYVHTSPVEFLNSYRLQVACDQLDMTSRSITDIALRCGFNHASYFSRLFLESFGQTPRQYRKRRGRQSHPDRV